MSADPRPLLVAGERVRTDATRPVVNPYSGAAFAEVCLAGPDEVERAAAAAAAAAPELGRLPAGERAAALRALADAVGREADAFADLIVREAGKPAKLARGEVGRAQETLRLSAEEATRLEGEALPLDRTAKGADRFGVVRRFPIGPVVGITPFNFPLNLALHKLGPAIAAGCPVVLKGADQTPLTLLKLGELFGELDLPRGSLSVLAAEVPAAERLVTDERFRLLSFTGSAKVGFLLKGKAGRKRVLLELGGNAAAYVDRSADVEQAAERCAFGAMAYSGQVCISVQRVYVHRDVADRFREALVAAVAAFPAGDPADADTVIGPLISADAAERVAGAVADAVAQGARVLTGGGGRDGAFYPATVLEDPPEGHPVSCEEVFGPVVGLHAVGSAEEGFERIDASPFGLQAGVFTDDVQQLLRAHESLEVGAVIHDDAPVFRVDAMPYGGVKASGLGREGPRYAVQEMTEPRLLVVRRRSP